MAVMEDNTVGVIEAGQVAVEAIGGLTGLQTMEMIEVVKPIEPRHPIRWGSVGVEV